MKYRVFRQFMGTLQRVQIQNEADHLLSGPFFFRRSMNPKQIGESAVRAEVVPTEGRKLANGESSNPASGMAGRRSEQFRDPRLAPLVFSPADTRRRSYRIPAAARAIAYPGP
jgi:hypothetical protein